MICPECEFENLPDSTFCTQCGHRFTDTKPATKAPYQVQPDFTLQITLACSLIFPGAGHLYLRQYAQGVTLFLTAVVSLALSVYYFPTINHAAAFTVFSAVVVYGIADAYRLAIGKNELPFRIGWIYTVVGVVYAVTIITGLMWGSRYYKFITIQRKVRAAPELQVNDQILIRKGYYADNSPVLGDYVTGRGFGYGKITHVEQDKFYVQTFNLRIDQDNGRVHARTYKIMSAQYPQIGKFQYLIAPIKRRRAF